jgi:deoxycytidine triphosphate deaminase
MRLSAKSIIDWRQRDPEFIQGVSLAELPGRLEGSKFDMTIESVHVIRERNYDAFIGTEERVTPATAEMEARDFPTLSKFPRGKRGWTLNEGYYLIRTRESLKLPHWMSATVHERTTVFKCGVIVRSTSVDPGFNGQIVAGLYVPDTTALTIEEGARVLSVEFEPIVQLQLGAFLDDQPSGFALSTMPDHNHTYNGIWGNDRLSTQGLSERPH